jgi:pyruvate formate lyase activating enzyme
MQEALFYEKLTGQKVRCYLCPRECTLKDGQSGFCYVRINQHGILRTMAYAHPYAINVDPIEKKPLFHVLPATSIFSLGTAGCNLGCKFCQNWDLSKSKSQQERAYYLSPKKIIILAKEHQCSSIAFTYNEPTIFAEYVMDTARLAHKEGLKTVMVTNGYITEKVIKDVYENIDAANVDLKGFSEEFYKKLTLSHLVPVLETLKTLHAMGVWIEITNLLIPGWNDSEKMITQLIDWVLSELGPDVPLHFTAFHPDYQLTDIPATPPETVQKARDTALLRGIHFAYVGNIWDDERSSTYCPSCKTLLIERKWYQTKIVNLSADGKCEKCGERIPGIWEV